MSVTHSYFTTDAYPGDRRARAWNDALGKLSFRIDRLNGDDRFYGRFRTIVSPLGISFSDIVSCAQKFSGNIDTAGQGIWLALHVSGRARLENGVGSVEIVPGDIAYGPLRLPFAMSFDSDFRELFVKVPSAILDARLLSWFSNRVGYIHGAGGVGQVFGDMLASIGESIDKLTSDQLRPIEIALTEFLATCLADDEAVEPLRGETHVQTSILNRVCQIIEAQLGDPDFTCAIVAGKAGISERYLQKLFENAGETFGHYLRLRRLERSRAELTNPLYAQLSITQICYRSGFNDSAHFSRAFREQYNTSPRIYRKMAGVGSASEPALQNGRGWPEGSNKELRRITSSRIHEWLPNQSSYDAECRRDGGEGAAIIKPAFGAALAHRHHNLPANEKTVHWGYFSKSLPPVLTVNSHDSVTIETLTHHANDDFERMIKGDPGAESVFHWTSERKNINRRGAGPIDASVYGRGAGEGFGVQICTGPIAVAGAEPGDVIELRILGIRPRPSANGGYTGRAFGSNAAAWWGFHYKDLLTEPKPREVVTIYEVDCVHCRHAKAVYNFRWTPQRDPSGVVHPTIDYPGVPVDHTTIVENHNVLKGVKIPLRPHFGVIGLAPKETEIVDATPPSYCGGNLDNWRAGPGASVFLPVSVPGGLLSIGDPHASQGDSELCGTAIECSLTGTFQIILHKKGSKNSRHLADLDYPLLETPTEWVIHGFEHANYLAELGEGAQSEIYKNPSLDPAMRDAFWKVRRFLMVSKGLSEDEAISLISVAVDFGITQIVDGNWCVHAVLRKSLFDEEGGVN